MRTSTQLPSYVTLLDCNQNLVLPAHSLLPHEPRIAPSINQNTTRMTHPRHGEQHLRDGIAARASFRTRARLLRRLNQGRALLTSTVPAGYHSTRKGQGRPG